MPPPPFTVEHRLPGWRLAWTRLERTEPGEAATARLRAESGRRCRRERKLPSLAADPTVAAVRRLFRAVGCDPTRYRPSSEALIRRLLKGEEIPAIHPLVDLNNALSVALAVPACVLAEGSFEGPVVLRRGEAGERYDSLRGDFDLCDKPLLADPEGPFGTPITDGRRVRVRPGTEVAWLVAYLPAEVLGVEAVEGTLEGLLDEAPVARASPVATSGDG